MKKLNINPHKFKLLTEYTFIDDQVDNNLSDYLLLDDDLNEADEVEVADEMPVDDSTSQPEDGSETQPEDSEEVDLSGDIEIDDESEAETEPPTEPLMGDEPAVEPEMEDDSVELDVTELVSGLDKTNSLAIKATQGIADLSSKLDRLTASLENMSAITSRIDNIEKEIIKRNPTQKEKLEMRSLDSYPYNLKLTDFWGSDNNPSPNSYVKSDNGVPSSNEYILTQKDVDSDYSESLISKTLDYSEEDDE